MMRLFILITALACSSCEHMCNNYIDCDARIAALQRQIAKLKSDIAKDRIAVIEVNEARCQEIFH